MKKTLLITLILIACLFASWQYFERTYPATAPLTSALYFAEHLGKPHTKLDKHIMGFLPYWQVDTIKYLHLENLSEVNYFSLTVGDDGHLVTAIDGQTDPGWREWKQPAMKDFITKSHIYGTEVSITVAALDNTLITSILDSSSAQQNLVNDIVKEVKTSNLDAVNIDFEYFGEPDAGYQQEFTKFSKDLATALKKETPKAKLSLSIMPLSARENGLFDFKELAPLYDHFIGMSYDYYGQNSDIAGPIAPMRGFKEGEYFFDVTTTYEDYRKFLPKEKIIMGLPYYGWEWAVEDGTVKNSTTFTSDSPENYSAVISYARGRESKDIKKNQCFWDELSQESWCWYKDAETGIDRQVWLMDNRAINTRFSYAKSQDFAGVAIWTLGYDKQYPDLWDMISKMFTHQ